MRAMCSRFFSALRPIAALLFLICMCADALAEDGNTSVERPWKLTVGDYRYSDYSGGDVNLRWRRSDTDAWLGVYSDQVFGTQGRAGADTSVQIAKSIQIQPSLQVATLGFVGGSLNIQAGEEWFGMAGIGRTNLKPYFNLNFDPNDALTFGAGHHGADGSIYTLFVVADDRLHTRQRDWHFNVRTPLGKMRATLDILRKSGISDAGYITGWGFTGTWDCPTWFLRLARDPYQNFSAQNAWRFSGGVRF
ncbi:MAG: hypothetical protein ACREVV_05515 [Steroidobacteraceae bacterium]